VVQEDLAPAYVHHVQAWVHSLYDVQQLLWYPNSPDLNLIEPCWLYMKRFTTRKGAPKSRKEAIEVWEKYWEEILQLNSVL
jgi:hypothetical protein